MSDKSPKTPTTNQQKKRKHDASPVSTPKNNQSPRQPNQQKANQRPDSQTPQKSNSHTPNKLNTKNSKSAEENDENLNTNGQQNDSKKTNNKNKVPEKSTPQKVTNNNSTPTKNNNTLEKHTPQKASNNNSTPTKNNNSTPVKNNNSTPVKNNNSTPVKNNSTPVKNNNSTPQKRKDTNNATPKKDKEFEKKNRFTVDPNNLWYALDTREVTRKETLEKQQTVDIAEISFGQRLASDIESVQADLLLENRKIQIEEKIPEILEKINLVAKDNAQETLTQILLDLKNSGCSDTDKRIIIKSVLLQIPYSGVQQLLQGLTQLFLLNPVEFIDAIIWLHLMILTRTDEINRDQEATSTLSEFSKQYQERLEHRTQLLKLRGRAQLLLSQIKTKQRQEVEHMFATKADKKPKEGIFDIPNSLSSDESSSSESDDM